MVSVVGLFYVGFENREFYRYVFLSMHFVKSKHWIKSELIGAGCTANKLYADRFV